jgi:hypothetical protein
MLDERWLTFLTASQLKKERLVDVWRCLEQQDGNLEALDIDIAMSASNAMSPVLTALDNIHNLVEARLVPSELESAVKFLEQHLKADPTKIKGVAAAKKVLERHREGKIDPDELIEQVRFIKKVARIPTESEIPQAAAQSPSPSPAKTRVQPETDISRLTVAKDTGVVLREMRMFFEDLSTDDKKEHRRVFGDGIFNLSVVHWWGVDVDQAQVAAKAADLQAALQAADWDAFRDISTVLERMAVAVLDFYDIDDEKD